jgi:hypothetical protein
LSANNNPSARVYNDARRSLHATAWMLVSATAFCMLFPVVLLRGMSLDGTTYATISRNLAVGIGDFWHPYYTATLLHPFHEQPPLAFLLEGMFFAALGDRWWVERLYSVLTVVPAIGALVLIWRRLLAGTSYQRFSWLAILFWIVMPAWFWIYRHNYLENTVGMFTALAVYSSLRATDDQRWWPAWTIVSAAAIVAALGSKGPVGLFPAVTPAIAWLTLRRTSFARAMGLQFALVVLLSVLGGLVWLHQPAREYLSAYFDIQVLNSLQGARETTESTWGRFYLAWSLILDLLVTALLAAVLVLWERAGRMGLVGVRGWGLEGNAGASTVGTGGVSLRGPVAFCLLTALSASLPIMISPKQSAYYAAPSWPFFCAALAIWCLPAVAALVDDWVARASFARASRCLRIAALGAAVLAVVLSPLWYGRALRDANLMRDVDCIARLVEPRDKIIMGPTIEGKWSLGAYLYRRHFISLEPAGGTGDYRLEHAEGDATPMPGYALEDFGLTMFRLYRRQDLATSPGKPAPPR